MVMDFYQKNPSAISSLRGTVYEEKILKLIKEKAKPNKKEISKVEAEKILKQSQLQEYSHGTKDEKKPKKKIEAKKDSVLKTKPKPSKKVFVAVAFGLSPMSVEALPNTFSMP